jgi:hypothetical protein
MNGLRLIVVDAVACGTVKAESEVALEAATSGSSG